MVDGNFGVVREVEIEAEDALQRAYGWADSRSGDDAATIGLGLIAIGRCILALGVRIDYALHDVTRRV